MNFYVICDGWCGLQPAAEGHISLSDLETVKVIGKGSGGVVQLVRHRWTNQTYALKVTSCHVLCQQESRHRSLSCRSMVYV